MVTCKNCIIPDDFPNNKMTDGICSFCKMNSKKFFTELRINKEAELLALIKNGKGNGYDCIVPISGGKDSAYILYYLVRNLKLNPLAVFFDNGFSTEHAKNNVEEICRTLNVKLIKKQGSKYRRKLVEEAWYISYYTKKIQPMCGNCENNNRTTAINEATAQGIKHIIWGSTNQEDEPKRSLNPEAGSFKDSFKAKGKFLLNFISSLKSRVKKLFGEGMSLKSIFKTLFHGFKYMYYFVMDNIKLHAPEGLKRYSPFLKVSLKNKEIETLYFYDYIPYDPFRQIEILKKEINWKVPLDWEAKMDCKLQSIMNYRDLKQTGVTNSGFKLSVFVRNGMISREEAVDKEKLEVVQLKEYFQSENLEIEPALKVMKDIIFK